MLERDGPVKTKTREPPIEERNIRDGNFYYINYPALSDEAIDFYNASFVNAGASTRYTNYEE